MSGFKFRREYLKKIHERYGKASKEEKTKILEEFLKTCKYHRKYAIRLLNAPLEESLKPRRKRAPHYSVKALGILEAIWKAAGYPWSVRLKALLPIWMKWAREKFGIDPKTEAELLLISSRQMDRRLSLKRLKIRKAMYGTTKPGSLLKNQIPIRTKNWDIKKAGYSEIDTVAHCGNSLDGEFIYTLNDTDIHATWTESVAVMGKGAEGVQRGLEEISGRLPYRRRGIDSDNGSEFMNHHLIRYCQDCRPRLEFTHSRPYEKEDQGHVEQKNFTHVRKVFGWDRYDTQEALLAMNDLYRNELSLWNNLFQPSVKLKEKIRKGSKLIRKYSAALTPFQRVLKCKEADPQKIRELQKLLDSTDPFELGLRIDRKLQRIYKMASQRVGSRIGFMPFKKQGLAASHLEDQQTGHVPTPSKNSAHPWKRYVVGSKSKKLHRLMRQTYKVKAA